ncbi:MAG: CapA family protein, partial [bacterium]
PEETRAILTQQGIATVGDPYGCDPEYAYVKGDLVVLAFNRVGDEAEADLLAAIRTIRQAHPSQFLVIFFHWGEEYQGHSSPEQQQLAHQAIDSGADLIVGSHPHVVQEIERYQGQDSGRSGLIVYSLGNFVFDQYFSVETQQGLALGIEYSPGKALIRLFPLTSELSQVRLMDDQESKAFLETLAQASDQTLVDQIRTGRIEISD